MRTCERAGCRRNKKLAIAYHWHRTGDSLKFAHGLKCTWATGARWFPEYSKLHGEGRGERGRVAGIELNECPVCYITAASEWLLELHSGSTFPTYGPNGAMPGPAILFGANIAKWPAWWHDAMVAISTARHQADGIELRS